MDGKEFLQELFSISPGRQVQVRQVPPKNGFTVPTDDLSALADLSPHSNWWYGPFPRTDGKVLSAVTVHTDIDGVDEVDPVRLAVAPTSALVSSGHGFHLYWFLEAETHVADMKKYLRLAQLAFDGDRQAANPNHLLRIPGTVNTKPGMDPVECTVVSFSGQRYSLEDLETALVGALLAPHWTDGQRNSMVQGFSLVCARAGWPQERATGIVRTLCRVTGDKEKANRLANVRLTYERHASGEAVTMAEFVDALGPKVVKQLLDILGYDARDGDLRYGEAVIGTALTVQQDVFKLLAYEEPRWAWSEGQVMEWDDKASIWRGIESATLATRVFEVLDQLVVVKDGRERQRPCKPSEAEGIARMIKGVLAVQPLPEPPRSLLALANGVLDLDSGDFREARQEDGFRVTMPVAYDPAADCPKWRTFMSEAVDEETADFLQEYVGYCLRPGNFFQRMAWLYGPPSTGKSTFLGLVFALFGPTAVTIASQNISQYQTATLAAAKLAMCTELSTQQFRTSTFKSLVSGDPVLARHPYGRPFTIQYTGKLMFGSNQLPTLDETAGMSRRLAIVPFTRVPERPNPTLGLELLEELPGVLNWAVEGARRVDSYVADRSWPLPECVVETVARYQSFSDLMDMFIREEVSFRQGAGVSTREAFMRFADFAKSMGQPTRQFGAWFTEEFVSRGAQVVDGLRLDGCELVSQATIWGLE
jgi:P4 family phage/plasmid primase-like protien